MKDVTAAKGDRAQEFPCACFLKSGCQCLKMDGWIGGKGLESQCLEARRNKCRAIFLQELGVIDTLETLMYSRDENTPIWPSPIQCEGFTSWDHELYS